MEARREARGWGSDTLLESYGDERRPIFKEARGFHRGRIRNDGAFLDRYNPGARQAKFDGLEGAESDVGYRAQVYEPNYEGSPVMFGPAGGVSHGARHACRWGARGHHLVPQKLTSGRDVFEELGGRVHTAGVRCG